MPSITVMHIQNLKFICQVHVSQEKCDQKIIDWADGQDGFRCITNSIVDRKIIMKNQFVCIQILFLYDQLLMRQTDGLTDNIIFPNGRVIMNTSRGCRQYRVEQTQHHTDQHFICVDLLLCNPVTSPLYITCPYGS